MIHSITLKNFRNFSNREISFCAGKNIIVWENGKWKSNILEAISFLQWWLHISDIKHLVKLKEDLFFLKICGDFWELACSYENETGKRKYILNGKNTTKSKLREIYPHIISFHPIEMNLMYFGPSERRDFLDSILIRTFPEYEKILKWYKLVIRNRNKVLKHISLWNAWESELNFWNEKYLLWAEKVYEYREKINKYFMEKIHSRLQSYFLGKTANIKYKYHSSVEWLNLLQKLGDLKKYIHENSKKEILLQKTLRWPHLDDFSILIDNQSITHYASRWEMKSALIWMLFIETEFIQQYGQKKETIFLLDDILSELDSAHRDMLWEYIHERQSIITSIEDCIDGDSKIFL